MAIAAGCFYALFAQLETPIDFDAIDEQPVDRICMLLAPETAGADHLKALARVSRLLRDRAICEKLRGTDSARRLLQERSSPRQSGVLPSANASMSHEDRKFCMAENVICNAPGQRLSERALRVGAHHKKVGIKSCCLVEDHIAQATVTEFCLDQCRINIVPREVFRELLG